MDALQSPQDDPMYQAFHAAATGASASSPPPPVTDAGGEDPMYQAFHAAATRGRPGNAGGKPQAPADTGGFWAGAKSTMGETAKGVGQFGADYVPGVSQDNALKKWGQEVVDANPTPQGLQGWMDHPLDSALAFGGGMAAGVGTAGGIAALGKGISAIGALPIPHPLVKGAALALGRGLLVAAPYLAFGAPAQSSIREQQIHDDPSAETDLGKKLLATAGAGTVGAITHHMGPAGKLGEPLLTAAGRSALGRRLTASTLPGEFVKGAGMGAGQALLATPVEQAASLHNPFSPDNLLQTAEGAVSGALGGGIIGGTMHTGHRVLRGSVNDTNTPKDLLNPEPVAGLLGYDGSQGEHWRPTMYGYPEGAVGTAADLPNWTMANALRLDTLRAKAEGTPAREVTDDTGNVTVVPGWAKQKLTKEEAAEYKDLVGREKRGTYQFDPVVDEHSFVNQGVPLPVDVGSAIAALRQLSPAPILAGSDEHLAVLRADQLLRLAGIDPSTVSPAPVIQEGASVPGGKRSAARKAAAGTTVAPEPQAKTIGEQAIEESDIPAERRPKLYTKAGKLNKDAQSLADILTTGTPEELLDLHGKLSSAATKGHARADWALPATEHAMDLRGVKYEPFGSNKPAEAPAAKGEVTPNVPASPVDAALAKRNFGGKLTTNQQSVMDFLLTAFKEHRVSDVLDAAGVWKTQEIADRFGFKNRGSAADAINRAATNIAKAHGMTVDQLRADLKARGVARRAVEDADDNKLGLSPDQQSTTAIEGSELFGNPESGAEQHMGIIAGPGGSQTEVQAHAAKLTKAQLDKNGLAVADVAPYLKDTETLASSKTAENTKAGEKEQRAAKAEELRKQKAAEAEAAIQRRIAEAADKARLDEELAVKAGEHIPALENEFGKEAVETATDEWNEYGHQQAKDGITTPAFDTMPDVAQRQAIKLLNYWLSQKGRTKTGLYDLFDRVDYEYDGEEAAHRAPDDVAKEQSRLTGSGSPIIEARAGEAARVGAPAKPQGTEGPARMGADEPRAAARDMGPEGSGVEAKGSEPAEQQVKPEPAAPANIEPQVTRARQLLADLRGKKHDASHVQELRDLLAGSLEVAEAVRVAEGYKNLSALSDAIAIEMAKPATPVVAHKPPVGETQAPLPPTGETQPPAEKVVQRRRVIKAEKTETPKAAVAEGVKPEELPKAPDTTPEQKALAQRVADKYHGRVVFQEGDLALVQGYSLTGDPRYLPVIGGRHAMVDVDAFTGTGLITPEQKARLSAEKARIEAEDASRHAANPFDPFKGEMVATSKSIPHGVAGVAKGWAKLLGLKGRLYITTVEDAVASRDALTGPYRAIGASGINAAEQGRFQRLANGDFYITLQPSTSRTRTLEVLAHELGHMHEKESWSNADPATKAAIEAEFRAWRDSASQGTARNLVDTLRAKTTAKTTKIPSSEAPATTMRNQAYWQSFSEWYADQVSKWATTSEKPLTVVEKFFSKLAQAMRSFYAKLVNGKYLPNATFKEYMDRVTERPLELGEEKAAVAEDVVPEAKPGTTDEATLRATLASIAGTDNHRNVTVFATAQDAIAAGALKSENAKGAQAWVHKGRAYFVAENIKKGHELAVFLHEVGVHLGMEKAVGPANYTKLTDQIATWLAQGAGVEGEIAKAAHARVLAAEGRIEGGIARGRQKDELLAYFVEEAVKRGIDPLAKKYNSELGRWFATLWESFKAAVRKLGFNPDKLSAQDMVDMAYGAARLELHGDDTNIRFSRAVDSLNEVPKEHLPTWASRIKGEYDIPSFGGWRVADIGEFGPIKRAAATVREYADHVELLLYDADLLHSGVQPAKAMVERFSLYKDDSKQVSVHADGVGHSATIARSKYAAQLDRVLSKKHGDFWKFKPGVFSTAEIRDAYRMLRDEANNMGLLDTMERMRITRATGATAGKESRYIPRERVMQFSKAAPDIDAAKTPEQRKEVDDRIVQNIDRIPNKALRDATGKTYFGIKDAVRNGLLGTAFIHDVVDHLENLGVKAVRKYSDTMEAKNRLSHVLSAPLQDLAGRANDLKAHELAKDGPLSVNKFMSDMSYAGKWAWQLPKDSPLWKGRQVQVDPTLAKRFGALSPAAQEVAKLAVNFGETMRQELAKVGVDIAAGDGPYLPHKRFGNWLVVSKSPEYARREAREDGSHEKLKADPNHYHVSAFENAWEAREFRNQQRANKAYAGEDLDNRVHLTKAEEYFSQIQLAPMQQIARLESMINSENGLSAKQKAAVVTSLQNLYKQTLSNVSARHAEQRRANVGGADADMLRALFTQGHASAALVASLAHGKEIEQSLTAMRDEAHNLDRDGNTKSALNEVLRRHALSMLYRPTPIQNKIMALTAFQKVITSPAFFLQQTVEPFMMLAPVLAGHFNDYRGTMKEMGSAYAQAMQTIGLNPMHSGSAPDAILAKLKGHKNSVGRDYDAIKELIETGRADLGNFNEFGNLGMRADKPIAHGVNTVLSKVSRVATDMEEINRIASGLTAYRMKYKQLVAGGKGADAAHTEATAYASKMVDHSHGNYSAWASPRYMMQAGSSLPIRLITQFRKFQVMELSLIGRLVHGAFHADTPESKAMAQRALAYMTGQMAVVAGGLGIPMAGVAADIASLFLRDDNEPWGRETTELHLRKMIGDPTLANLLLHGAPAGAGVDVSKRIGGGGMGDLAPYSELDVGSRKGFEGTLPKLLGPFIGGTLPSTFDAYKQMRQGEYQRGMESLAPTLIANMSKAQRFAEHGVTNAKGDVLLKPEQLSSFDIAAQALGLPSTHLTDRQFKQSVLMGQEEKWKEMEERYVHQYVKASRDKDAAEKAAALASYRAIQDAKRKAGGIGTPLSSILKAPMEQMRRQVQNVGGVEVTKQTRGIMRQLEQQGV